MNEYTLAAIDGEYKYYINQMADDTVKIYKNDTLICDNYHAYGDFIELLDNVANGKKIDYIAPDILALYESM